MTERLLIANGWLCDCTESFNAHSGYSRDFLGFADFVAAHPFKHRVVAIQVTTSNNRGARFKKITASIEAFGWMRGGGEVWLITWKRAKEAGRLVWEPEKLPINEADFPVEFVNKFDHYWSLRGQCSEKDIAEHKIPTRFISL